MRQKYVIGIGVAVIAVGICLGALYHRRATAGFDSDGTFGAGTAAIPTLRRMARRGTTPKEFNLTQKVDVLDFLDAKMDTVAGSWGFEDKTLVTSGVSWGRLQFPIQPPDEYELELRAVRKGGTNSLNIGLVSGGRQVILILDGWDKGDKSGLDRVGDKSFFENETTYTGRLLPQGTPVTIQCKVRTGAINATVGGKTVVHWEGDPKKLSIWPDWAVPQKQALFVGSWESTFWIEEVSLTPVSGGAILIR